MDKNFVPVLQQLAAREDINAANLYIEGNVVFLSKGNELVGTVCQIDTPYWNAAESAAEVFARLQGRNLVYPASHHMASRVRTLIDCLWSHFLYESDA